MDPKKAITERTEAAARDLYGARHAERLRPVGYMQIETKETWKQLGCGAVSFLIAFAVVLILARVIHGHIPDPAGVVITAKCWHLRLN